MFNQEELRKAIIADYMKRHDNKLDIKLPSNQIVCLSKSSFTLPYQISYLEGGINKTSEGSFTYQLNEFDVNYNINKNM